MAKAAWQKWQFAILLSVLGFFARCQFERRYIHSLRTRVGELDPSTISLPL